MADQFEDEVRTCTERRCGQQFVFTAGEQEFYKKKGFKDKPKRCKSCREKRKASREGGNGNEGRDVEQTKEFWEQDRLMRDSDGDRRRQRRRG